jgi:putative salt-induced outer membrane protein YdiY
LTLLGLLGPLLAAAPTWADVVHTSDGSRLVGQIERLFDGKLLIVTEIAGRLEIDASKITAVSTDQPVTVQFASGDRLVGTIEALEGGDETIVHTALGDISVRSEEMTALWPQGAENPEIVAVKLEAEQEMERLRPKWSAKLEAGGVMKEGNTDTLDARGRFDLKRTSEDDLLEFFLAADYSEQNDKRTRNEYRGGVRYESKLDTRRYWYTRLEFEFDEFENLDLRSTAAVGGGYYFLKRPDRELKTSLGFGYRHESFSTGVTDDAAVVDLGLNYRADLAPWVQFTHAAVLSPDIEDFGDYRLDLDTALVLPLQHEAWKLKIGIRNEYNSKPQRAIERLDNTYYANILLDVK